MRTFVHCTALLALILTLDILDLALHYLWSWPWLGGLDLELDIAGLVGSIKCKMRKTHSMCNISLFTHHY